MTGFLLTLIPAGLLCGGVAIFIRALVNKDTTHYDINNLWEDSTQGHEDMNLK